MKQKPKYQQRLDQLNREIAERDAKLRCPVCKRAFGPYRFRGVINARDYCSAACREEAEETR